MYEMEALSKAIGVEVILKSTTIYCYTFKDEGMDSLAFAWVEVYVR